jgi:hypothetical protein
MQVLPLPKQSIAPDNKRTAVEKSFMKRRHFEICYGLVIFSGLTN